MHYRFRLLLTLLWMVIPKPLVGAEELPSADDLAKKAFILIKQLDAEQVDPFTFPFEAPSRTQWHYVPRARAGVSLGSLNKEQGAALWSLLGAAMSRSGVEKVKGIIAAERVLWEQSKHSDFRDPGKYYLSFYGEPGSQEFWSMRFEGHHLSINLTVVEGNQVFLTPSFFGSNPDTLPDGARPLAAEYERALSLVNSLTEEQRSLAISSGRMPREIITRARSRVNVLEVEGLSVAEMSTEQRVYLMRLIQEYVGRYRESFAQNDLRRMDAAGIENIHFFWAGKTEPGNPVYYRIHGPTFVMEYANTQNRGNHAHTVWRDFENDFGYEALSHHFKKHH